MKTMSYGFRLRFVALTACCVLPAAHCLPTAEAHWTDDVPGFERTIIDNDFPGAYQVEIADVNGDKKLDVVAVGGSTCAWYENPTWRKRIVTDGKRSPGIISSATADLDADGKAEIAIAYEFAMNTPTTGKLMLAVAGRGLDDDWKLVPIADIGSIHRLRWGEITGDDRLDLVVAPLFGPTARPPRYLDPAELLYFDGSNDLKAGKGMGIPLARRPVLHAIELRPAKGDEPALILTADNGGVARIEPKATARAQVTHLVAGAAGELPKRGCSEIHQGHRRDGSRFLATVEPWHGNQVAVYTEKKAGEPSPDAFTRLVIDDTLVDGHALWLSDVDRDGDDEIFAGHRGADHRVSMYQFNKHQNVWIRTVIDREVAAQDLRGGDLNGDGIPDVVAVGGSTHNVVWYRFRRQDPLPR